MATIDPMAQLFSPDLMAQYRALLEPPQEAKRAAGMDALLALGLGLLGNRSPYFGVALGNAGAGAMGAHRYALDTARQNRMGEIQGAMGLRKLSKDINQEQARDKAFNDWLATQPPEKQAAARAAYLGAPESWAKFMAEQQFPKMEPYTLGAGQQRRGPNNEILAELPAEPKQSELGRLWAEFHSYPVGSPERQSIMRKINKEETHAPGTNLNVSYGAPVPVQLPTGEIGYGQPGNREGAPAKLMVDPVSGQPLLKPKDPQQVEAEQKKETKLQMQRDEAATVLGAVTDAKGLVDWSTAGLGSYATKIPGSKATDLAAKLETIKANLAFSRLQQMRDASPTGGALGQVAVQELEALRSTVSSLDQRQSPQQLVQSLNKIERHYKNWVNVMEQAASKKPSTTQGTTQLSPEEQKELEALRQRFGRN